MTIDELEHEIEQLSDLEREWLFERFDVVRIDIRMMIPDTIQVILEDESDRPIVTFIALGLSRELNCYYGRIDLIASIENDATSIGHPAILHAIETWEIIVQHHYRLPGYSELVDRHLYRRAKSNLQRVGKALLAGAMKRAISKETMYAAQVRLNAELGLYTMLQAA